MISSAAASAAIASRSSASSCRRSCSLVERCEWMDDKQECEYREPKLSGEGCIWL